MTLTMHWHAGSMDEWRKTEFARLFPESAKRASLSAPESSLATPTAPQGPAPASLPPPSSTTAPSDAPRPVSDEEAAQFLGDPGTLVGKRFVCSPPEDDDELDPDSDCGLWEVVSFRVHQDEGIVDREFMVLTEEFPDDPLPMGEKQVEAMLRHSTLAV